MKKSFLILPVASILIFLFCNAFFMDKDPLHGKKFSTNATEYSNGSPKTGAKTIPYDLEFKNGKLYYYLAADSKGGGFDQWIKYEITKDSVYMDEDLEKRYFAVKASKEDDDGRIITISVVIDDTDIDGSLKLVRRDKLMKHFEFNGEEKSKKK
ncbi:MAG: hypothetical protein ACK5D5_05795 [Bacteroidota bacterium]|jgi:hypothetical protein